MRVSVVIATYRGAERLKRLLPTIVDPMVYRDGHEPTEVIVVDDGSPEGEWPAISAAVSHAKIGPSERQLLHVAENRGYAHCVRDGVSVSTGEVILLCDDDVRLPDGFFSVLHELMSLPNIGVLSWRSEGPNPGQSRSPVRGFLEPATQIASYCYAFRRKVWDEVGGFDTRFKFFCIDSDFALRVMLTGRPCYRVWWPLVPHDEHGGAVDTVAFSRNDVGSEDTVKFFQKWGATGDEMEKRALEGLLKRAEG